MSLLSNLPSGWLLTIESVLRAGSFVCAILAPILGLGYWYVSTYRSSQEITSVRQDLTKARKDAEEARKETAEIRAQQEPRKLSPTQRERLVGLLSEAKGTEIFVTGTVGSLESMQYATQLAEALRQAGWNVKDVLQWDVYFSGVAVLEAPASERSGVAGLLRNGLKSVGVVLNPMAYAEAQEPPGPIHLAVGVKP
jgi:hypothetical protein